MNATIWGRWLARLFKQAPKRTRLRKRPQSRLGFESLEDRLTPTTYTWTGLGGSSNWNVAANWSSSAGGSAAPSTAVGAIDDLVFGALTTGASKPTNNNFTGLVVNSITFSANPAAGSNYTLGGNAITLVGGINVGANLGTETISLNMTLTPPTSTLQQTFTVPSASTLNISGILSEKEAAVGSNSAAVETAEETLTKAGAGTLQLDGSNSNYTGAITIASTGGILVITNSDALGLGQPVAGVPTAGTTTVNAGTQLQINGTNGPLTVPEQLILNGTGIINDGALLNTVNNNTWSGLITMDSNSTLGANASTTLTVSAKITDVSSGFSLSKAGPGTVALTHVGGDTYRGQTIINNGILEITDPLSLGAGANSSTVQSGTPQAETVVNYNPTTGVAGTLEINFNGAVAANDPNGILTNPNLVYNAKTNPYIGFQVFNDIMVLNGPGYSGLGALYNLNGDNDWDGPVILGSPSNVPNTGNVTISVAATSTTAPNTTLTVAGVVTSATPLQNPAANLLKIGGGVLAFSDDNTYVGNTYVENGALNVSDSGALGSAATNNVYVGYNPGFSATGNPAALQLSVDSGLDGTMAGGVLEETHYRNLGFDSTNGAGPGQELDVTGTTGTFTLSLTTYTSTGLGLTYTTGSLNIASPTFTSDLTSAVTTLLNNAGFNATGNVNVTEDIAGSGTGNIYRINFTGALNDADIPLMSSSLSTVAVNSIYGLTITNHLFITGTGFGPGTTGALDSVSGINTYSGPISLPALLSPTVASIGVESDTRTGHSLADANYLTNDYSLTITGNGTTSGIILGGPLNTLYKSGLGDLILPTANNYTGPNDILAGWVTVQNNESLGVQQNLTQTMQSYTTVASGAAVMLDPQSSFLTLANNFVLSGDGITPSTKAPVVPNVFGLIDEEGAIENQSGSNYLTGIIQLNGNAGVGVEQVFSPPANSTPTSQLTISGTLEDDTSGKTAGSLTKLGSRRLVISGPGTFTGNVNIDEGVLLLQNSTGLGEGNVTSPPTVTVANGAALEIGNTTTAIAVNNALGSATYTSSESGGIQEGLEVWGENLILDGAGDPTFDDTSLTVLSSNAPTTGPEVQTLAVNPTGSFTLTYGGQTTTTLAATANPYTIEAALNSLTSITNFAGAYSTVLQNGNVFIITITNPTDPDQALTATPVVPANTGNTVVPVVGTTQSGSNTEVLAPLNDPLISTDNIWEGPAALNTNTTITVPASSRLIMAGNIGNGSNVASGGYGGSSLTFVGGGELDLDGNNTFSGTTYIDQGVVTAGSSTALGATGVPEIQTLKLTGATANSTKFILTFTNLAGVVEPTSTITYTGNVATDEADITAALDALTTIGGSDAGGSVNVTEVISSSGVTLTITFGGTLSGFPQNLLSAAIMSGTGAFTVVPLTAQTTGTGGTMVANGASLQLSGSVTVAGEPLIIQGTGELQDTQTLTATATAGTFQLSFTGADATGNVVTDTTATPLDAATLSTTDIKNALLSLGNIGGVGGTVTVTQTGDTYTIVFGGTLAGKPLQTLTVTDVTAYTGGTVTATTTQVGDSAAQSIPTQWFEVGPDTTTGGQTAGNSAVAGSVTSIAVDPDDANTIYIGTNGGGVFKTINGGANWYPIFDSIPEIQTITLNNAVGTFTLSFGGDTTTALSVSDSNLALDIESALDDLGSIGGAGGQVTVFQNGTSSYQVTFGGELAGLNEPLITTNILNGSVKVSLLEAGTEPSFAMYVGAIAINPNFPNVIYVGTGVTNNATDSFYGTGIYESTNAGVTWSLLANNTTSNSSVSANPFNGRGISAMTVDPNTNELIVSDGDSTPGQDEVQTLTFNLNLGETFTLRLTAADSTGALVTQPTPAIPFTYGTYTDPVTGTVYTGYAAEADQIQYELNQLSNIGGVGGFVSVPLTPPAAGFNVFTVTFEGNLSLTTLDALQTSYPLPDQAAPPTIGVQVSAVSGPTTVVNGTTGVNGSAPGVWRFTPSSGTATTGIWQDLTSTPSITRSSSASANGNDPIYGPGGTMPGEPDTPGPDDDYQLYFPQSDATWSDVQLGTTSVTDQTILYAALGSSDIGTINTPAGTAANAVYWTADYELPPADMAWYIGNPFTGTLDAGNAVLTPDNESGTMFPVGDMYQGDNSGQAPENGNIKISIPPENYPETATGDNNGTFSDEPINFGYSTIYAAVSTPGGALENIYVSTDGGVDWAAVSPPGDLASDEGQYDFAIQAYSPNVVLVGGQVSSGDIGAESGQIYLSLNGGGTWSDISTIGGSGPHDSQHAIVLDDANGFLFGNDGGVWLLNSSQSGWTDINGNLANSEVNSVATDPTNITGIATSPATVTTVAGLQANGTAGFSEGQTWAELDDHEGGEMGTNQVFIAPTNPSVIYEEQTQIGSGMGAIIRESNNDGATWNTILDDADNPTISAATLDSPTIQSATVAFEMDQINPERLLVGGDLTLNQEQTNIDSGLYETLDGTDATPVWTNIAINNNTGAVTLPITVSAIGLAEYQGTFVTDPNFTDVTDQGANAYVPNTIYVTNGTNVYLTKDGGLTWIERDSGLTGGNIVQLVVDPRDENTVYAVQNAFNVGNNGVGGVWVSYNAGQTWTQIGTANGLPNEPVWSLALDARNNNLYVGTDTGVYELVDGGASGTGTWQVFGTGMPDVQVHDLVLNPTTNTLLAATYGRGVFELLLDNAETVAAPVSTSAATGLSGPTVWSGNLILEGNISLGADGAQNLPNGISTGSIDFVGTISDMIAGSDPTITKVGGGDVIFSGNNTYGGLTDVQQGNLVVDNSQALGANATGSADGTIVEDGASLELESNLGSESIALNGDGSLFDDHYTGSLRNISGDNTYTGNVTYGTDNPNGTVTFGADSGSTLTLTGIVSGPSDLSFVKEGTGTISLAGDDTYSGSTYVYEGALQAENNGALGTGSAGATVEVLDGAQLELHSTPAGAAISIAGIPLLLSGTGIFGTGALLNTLGVNSWTGAITLALLPGFSQDTLPSGDVSIGANSGTTLTLQGSIGELQETGQYGNGQGFQQVGQESGINKVGAGTLVLQNPHATPNTFSGGVTVSQGLLIVGDSGALGTHPTKDPSLGTVQQIVTLSNEQTGTFQLSFDGATTTLAYGTTAAALQSKLNSGGGLFKGAGTVSVIETPIETTNATTPTSLTQSGNLYTLTFGGGLLDTEVPISATGATGTVAGASFVTTGGNDVLVDTGTELDLNNINASTTPINVVGHTIGLNGSGISGNGALQNTYGDNTWDGPIIEETGPTSNGTTNSKPTLNSSIGATSGTSLTLAGQVSVDLFNSAPLPLTVGGAGTAGAGTLIFPTGTSFTGETIITNGNLQVDGVLGTIKLSGGAVGGVGSVGKISDANTNGGIVNPGDNGDTTLVNGKISFPVEAANTNVAGTLTSTGVTFSANDTYDVYFGDPATAGSSDLLQVNGAVVINKATISGYINPNVLIGNSTTVIQTNYDNGANPSDTVTGTFAEESPTGSTPTDPGAGILATTTAYIDNEKFLVDYYVDHVVITRVAESVTLSAITITTPAGAPTSPVYGEDVQASVTLIPEVNTVVLTGSTVVFQITDPEGNNYLFNETVTASSANVYTASIDLPVSLLTPLSETTNPVLPDYTVSVLYDGQVSDGATLFNPVSDGTVVSDPTATVVHPAANVPVTATNTTTTLKISPTSSGSQYSYGSQLTFTATVASTLPTADQPPGESSQILPPEGTVAFYDNLAGVQTLLGYGTLSTTGGVTTATFATTTLGVGNHSITATYLANGIPDNYNASSSNAAPIAVLVTQVPSTMTLTSNPVFPTASPYSGQITFTATVSAPSGNQGLPTGTVTFQDGATTLGTAQLFTVGGVTSASFTTAAFQIPADYGANQTITASYAGDGNFEPSAAATLVKVAQIGTATTVQSSANPSSAGQSVTFTATVNPSVVGGANPTGTVIFEITNGTQMIESSAPLSTLFGLTTATFTTNQIQAGTGNVVTATYSGDSNYLGNTGSPATLTQTVNAAATSTFLTAAPTSVTPNQAVTLTATVTSTAPGGGAAFGVVRFYTSAGAYLGAANLNSSGVGSIQIALGAPIGIHDIYATFLANTSFTASNSNTIGVNVVQGGTRVSKITVISSENPSTLGDIVTFAAIVKDAGTGAAQTPTGTVTFKDTTTGVTLGYGVLSSSGGVTAATLNTASLPVGVNNITATYSGTTVFAAEVSAPFSQVVKGIETTSVTLASSLNPAYYGQPISFTADVTDTYGTTVNPTGTVTFTFVNTSTNAVYSGTATLKAVPATLSSQAIFATTSLSTPLPAGTYTVTATYNGDNTFLAGSNASLTQVIAADPSTTTLKGTTSSIYGQADSYTATVVSAVTGSVSSGTVTFYANGTSIGTVPVTTKSGKTTATVSTKGLVAGSYSIQAVYNGTTNVQTSTSGAVNLTVNQDSATVSLAASSTTQNTPVTFTASVVANAPGSGVPTGTVSFYVQGNFEGTSTLNSSGKATLTFPSGFTGSQVVEAIYSGDADFFSESKTITVNFVQGRQT